MKIKLSELREAAGRRPAGYLEEVLGSGRVDGEWLVVSPAVYMRLVAKYRRVGDAVALVAQPVARVIDRVAGSSIQTCGGCAKRKAALNRFFQRGA